jgi:hypothetical protein
MIKKKGNNYPEESILVKKENKLKTKCKLLYVKAKILFVKSKPFIRLTDLYLTSSSVIKLIVDIFMIYTFGTVGAVYYIY